MISGHPTPNRRSAMIGVWDGGGTRLRRTSVERRGVQVTLGAGCGPGRRQRPQHGRRDEEEESRSAAALLHNGGRGGPGADSESVCRHATQERAESLGREGKRTSG